MIICPYCGTRYLTFQSNCKNCGGLLPGPDEIAASGSEELPIPPPAPRQISDRYIWRLLYTEAWAIAASVFCLIGIIFTLVGFALTLGIITAFVGIPFLLLGLLFLGAGGGLLAWQYQNAQKVVSVLREGNSGLGRITELRENPSVRVNGRYPWVIEYEYQVNGRTYTGKVSTFNRPGPQLQTGKAIRILYLADEPTCSSIYPHP